MADLTPELLEAIDELVRRGERARGTIRPAEATDPIGTRAPAIAADDWSVSRRFVYDQPMTNRWKTDTLRFLRARFGDDSTLLGEMNGIIDRAGVLWRAVDPGLALLRRIRAEHEGLAT